MPLPLGIHTALVTLNIPPWKHGSNVYKTKDDCVNAVKISGWCHCNEGMKEGFERHKCCITQRKKYELVKASHSDNMNAVSSYIIKKCARSAENSFCLFLFLFLLVIPELFTNLCYVLNTHSWLYKEHFAILNAACYSYICLFAGLDEICKKQDTLIYIDHKMARKH